MNFKKIEKNKIICVVESDTTVITDAQSELDILMNEKYNLSKEYRYR